MHARLDPIPTPSWGLRIWDDSSPSQDRAYAAIATISNPPPVAYISGMMVRHGERWTKAHRRALNDELWRAGYRWMRWYGFREGRPVVRFRPLSPPAGEAVVFLDLRLTIAA